RLVLARGAVVWRVDFAVEHDGRAQDDSGAGTARDAVEPGHARHPRRPGSCRRSADDRVAGVDSAGRRHHASRGGDGASAESEYGHQALSDVIPLRDLFGMLFFVSVGMLLDPAIVWQHLGTLSVVVIVVAIGKAAIL